MSQEETVMNLNKKKITTEELLELLQNPIDDILEGSQVGTAILIDGYIIEDEHLMLYDIEIGRKITFINCCFNNEILFHIGNIECNEDVVFEACTFPKNLVISQSTFKKNYVLNMLILIVLE